MGHRGYPFDTATSYLKTETTTCQTTEEVFFSLTPCASGSGRLNQVRFCHDRNGTFAVKKLLISIKSVIFKGLNLTNHSR